MSLIYCYGVIHESDTFNSKITGFEEQEVYSIEFKDVKAVVSNVSEENFSQEVIDKNIKDMRWLTKNAQVHEKIIDSIMDSTNILPMKFCTIFEASENIIVMLEEKYADLKYNLNNLKDKVEMGVKVYFDSTPIKQRIINCDEEIKCLEQEAKEKKPGAAYFVKQKIDILLKDKLEKELFTQRKTLFQELKQQSIDSKQNDLISKKVTGKDMLLNAVFLIGKGNAKDFRGSIEQKKIDVKNMDLEVYGPFPPYNFIR
jgi:hypothetical protein